MDRIQSCSKALHVSTSLVPLLSLVASDATEPEMKRAAGKVDRALERLRRIISAWLERFSVTDDDQVISKAKELLSIITNVLELTIKEVTLWNTASDDAL